MKPDKFLEQRAFHQGRRDILRQRIATDRGMPKLIIITGNSFMQASADQAYRFEQDSNFFYLTGITEPEIILVMDGDDEYLIMPERSKARIAFDGAIDTARMTQVSGIKTIIVATEGWKRLGELLKKRKQVSTIAPSEPYISYFEMFTNPSRKYLVDRMKQELKSLKIHDIRPYLNQMRMVKNPYEIKMIQRAITETNKLFTAIENIRNSVNYEHELTAEITSIRVKRQLTNAFDPIIASGKNTPMIHYVKNNARLDKKGMLLIDIGLKYNGYCADLTRTISYAPSKRQQEVFKAVSDVHSYAISLLKPGILIREYEEQVFEFMGLQLQKIGVIKKISKELVREWYPQLTSHFLGIDVHDAADYAKPLEAGMVLTVEPGIYIKKESIGIRLEDDVLITKNGCKVLSGALPKNISSLTIQP